MGVSQLAVPNAMANFSDSHRKKVADVLVSGELARTASRLFYECDGNESGALELALGEVCMYVVEVFELLDLARPLESLIYDVYKRFDTGNKGSLNFEESLQLVVYLCNVVLGTQTPPMGMLAAPRREMSDELLGTLGSGHREETFHGNFESGCSIKSTMTEPLELESSLNICEEQMATSTSSTLPTMSAPQLTSTPSTSSRRENHSPEPRTLISASLAQQMFREDSASLVQNGFHGRETMPAPLFAKTIYPATKVQPQEIAAKPLFTTRAQPPCNGSLPVPKSLEDSLRSTTPIFPLTATSSNSTVAAPHVARAPSRERCSPFLLKPQSLPREQSVDRCRRSPSQDNHRYVPNGTATPRLPPHPASSSVSFANLGQSAVVPPSREVTTNHFLGYTPSTTAVARQVSREPVKRQVSCEPVKRQVSCEPISIATTRPQVIRQVSPVRLISSGRQVSPSRVVRQPSPTRPTSLSRCGCWAPDRSIALDTYPRGPFAGKVKILPRRAAADANIAVELLNSGTIECREDFAVVFSESLNCHVLLYKAGKEQEALAGLEMP